MKKQQFLVASMSCQGAAPLLFWIHRGKAHEISSERHLAAERTWNLEMDWIHAQGGTKAGWIDARHLCHLSPAAYTLPPSTHLVSRHTLTSYPTGFHPSTIPHPFPNPPPCLMPPVPVLGCMPLPSASIPLVCCAPVPWPLRE